MVVLEIGDLVADKFRIERVLGRGGMGYVMAARHVRLGHRVAIKILIRELKPANLFREKRADGSVTIKVLDFGISNMLPADPAGPSSPRWTDTKSLVGSPQYMSPEQVRNPKTIDPRSDVWSLGVILYEL